MSASRFSNGDVISGAVLAGLGVYIVVEARQWEYLGPDGPGPGFFPIWYGIIMAVLAVAVTAGAFLRHQDDGKPVDWREVRRALTAWVAMACSVALFKPLGFVLAFGLFTWFVVTVLYRRSVRRGLAVAVACSAGFYAVFPLGLDVKLPVGMLGI